MARLHGGGWDGIGQDGGGSMALTASNFMFSLIKLYLKKKRRGHSILWPGVASYRQDILYEGSFSCDSDRPLSRPFHLWEETTGFELGRESWP